MNSLFDLSGKTAAVLGGTGELGGGMALALAQAGAQVAVLGRNAQNGAAKVAAIQSAGRKSQFFLGDALHEAAPVQTRHASEASLGEVSILVNAAGGTG